MTPNTHHDIVLDQWFVDKEVWLHIPSGIFNSFPKLMSHPAYAHIKFLGIFLKSRWYMFKKGCNLLVPHLTCDFLRRQFD